MHNDKKYFGFYCQHMETTKSLNKPGVVKMRIKKRIDSSKFGGNSKS